MVRKIRLSLRMDPLTLCKIPLREWLQRGWQSESGVTPTKKERWKIENKFPELLETALQLKKDVGFIIANTYSPRLEAPAITKICKEKCNSEYIQVDTLSLKTSTNKTLEFGQRTLIQ